MRAALAALCVAACGQQDGRDETRRAIETFRAQVCACKELACVTKVTEDLKRRRPANARPASTAEQEILKAAEACVSRLARPTPSMPPVDAAPPPVDAMRRDEPEVPADATADALMRAARDWQLARHPGIGVRTVLVSYVEADGKLDPEHGALRITHGAPDKPFDDPDRKLGAPVRDNPKRPELCPMLDYSAAPREWREVPRPCADTPLAVARCTVTAIWQRAIAKGAPAEALATVRYAVAGRGGEWRFEIIDEPRKVHISHRFADDCELAVEKP